MINPGPSERVIHAKESCEFEYGDVISFRQPGAGGYGDPATRDPARVLDDVQNDFISLETAREAYGVVIDPTTWTVDATATERLRATMRIQGDPPVVTRSDAPLPLTLPLPSGERRRGEGHSSGAG